MWLTEADGFVSWLIGFQPHAEYVGVPELPPVNQRLASTPRPNHRTRDTWLIDFGLTDVLKVQTL